MKSNPHRRRWTAFAMVASAAAVSALAASLPFAPDAQAALARAPKQMTLGSLGFVGSERGRVRVSLIGPAGSAITAQVNVSGVRIDPGAAGGVVARTAVATLNAPLTEGTIACVDFDPAQLLEPGTQTGRAEIVAHIGLSGGQGTGRSVNASLQSLDEAGGSTNRLIDDTLGQI